MVIGVFLETGRIPKYKPIRLQLRGRRSAAPADGDVARHCSPLLAIALEYVPLAETLLTDPLFYPGRVTGGELFEDIVAREYYSEADAR